VRVLTYTLTRLGIFGVCVLLLWWFGMGGWLLVAVAAVAAWALSYLLLPRQRAAAVHEMAERAERRRAEGRRFTAGIDADAATEDAAAEDAAAEGLAAGDGTIAESAADDSGWHGSTDRA